MRINDATFAEDLEHASPEAREAFQAARRELERDGINRERLHPCESEHRDGTDLAGLVKSYLPAPIGPWGAVFAPGRDDEGVHLIVVAFGARHPRRRPTVYDVAHRRQHGSWPPGMHASP